MEYNHCLEHLEARLYERVEELVDECRYDEARQIIDLMRSCELI